LIILSDVTVLKAIFKKRDASILSSAEGCLLSRGDPSHWRLSPARKVPARSGQEPRPFFLMTEKLPAPWAAVVLKPK
jgi:hypothetical protein